MMWVGIYFAIGAVCTALIFLDEYEPAFEYRQEPASWLLATVSDVVASMLMWPLVVALWLGWVK